MKDIGRKLRDIRKKKGFTQEELAESSKINLRTIQRIEKNENEPHGKTLHLICKVLEVNVEEILDYGKKVDKSYLVIFHLSVLVFLAIPVGNIIIPLILWLNKKDKIIKLGEIGANLLNFQIIWSILTFSSVILFAYFKIMHYDYHSTFLWISIGLYSLNIILPIIFAIMTNNGKIEKLYPRVIRLIK